MKTRTCAAASAVVALVAGTVFAAQANAAPAPPRCHGYTATAWGGSGADGINTGTAWDVVTGMGGNDRIDTGANHDVVCGGTGSDRLSGASGSDLMAGGDGRNYALNWGDDVLTGGAGRDTLRGSAGNDTFYAQDGERDYVYGFGGKDTCYVDRMDVFNGCEFLHIK